MFWRKAGGNDAAVLWLFFVMQELPRWNSPEVVHISGQSSNGRSQRHEKGQLWPPSIISFQLLSFTVGLCLEVRRSVSTNVNIHAAPVVICMNYLM